MDSIYSVGKGRRAGKKKEVKEDDEGKGGESKRSPGVLRMQIDMSELDLPETCKLSLDSAENIMSFRITIKPDTGFWKGASYSFKIDVSDNYPHKPPKVVCEDPVGKLPVPLSVLDLPSQHYSLRSCVSQHPQGGVETHHEHPGRHSWIGVSLH
jgi:hypothetical protein